MALTDNLISYWELEEASGTRNDSHGTNHLTDNNTVLNAAGKVGNAADFEDTSSEYLSCADNATLSVGNIDFTLCAWVRLESKPSHKMDILGKHGGSDMEYDLRWNNLTDRFELRVCSGPSDANLQIAESLSGAPSTATFYFIVAWHDATANTVNIQVNNGTVDSVTHTFGSYDSGASFKIGGFTDFNEYWDGLIDQVGFWKRVLTAPERTSLYNSGNGLSYAALTGGAAGWGGLLGHKANRLVVPVVPL